MQRSQGPSASPNKRGDFIKSEKRVNTSDVPEDAENATVNK